MTPKQIKQWRKDKQLTQTEAAEKVFVCLSTWQKWEYNINPIPKWLDMFLRTAKK